MEHDALAQLAKGRLAQLLIQFRLAREDYLQELAPRSLEIEQQAKFIESLRGESLGFIKDKHREIPGGMALRSQVCKALTRSLWT
jgi:hypothetical protein